jgi:undecaprenyl-diphosphatase
VTLLQALILGIVQGATEYIPVSSSAHLVLVPWLLGWPDPSFAFEVLVQWGTLVGVFVFFWRDIVAIVKAVVLGLVARDPLGTFDAKLGWMIFVASIPAGGAGLLFKDYFEIAYSMPVLVGILLSLNALVLVIGERFGKPEQELTKMSWLDSVIIGVWQIAAIFPGISRSGSTITGGMLRTYTRPAAARFSFLMSIPIMLGAGVVALKDLFDSGTMAAQLPAITVGFIAAAISGYICIRWLLRYLQNHSLYVFAVYCVGVSVLTVVVALYRYV